MSKLDDILGGGWPEYSFNVIVGEPGSGKTMLAHQFMFANATSERRAVYLTVLGERTIKMLRYQQQFTFVDMAKVNDAIHFLNLTEEALSGDLSQVLNAIVAKVSSGSHAGHHLGPHEASLCSPSAVCPTAMWKSLGTTNSLEISIANSAAGPKHKPRSGTEAAAITVLDQLGEVARPSCAASIGDEQFRRSSRSNGVRPRKDLH